MIEAKSVVVKVIVQLIRSLLQGIADLDRKIEEVAAAHPDWCGRGLTISNNDVGAATTTQRYERWLSNGFASYSVAGKIESSMTKANT